MVGLRVRRTCVGRSPHISNCTPGGGEAGPLVDPPIPVLKPYLRATKAGRQKQGDKSRATKTGRQKQIHCDKNRATKVGRQKL